jgi:hypothetical protein
MKQIDKFIDSQDGEVLFYALACCLLLTLAVVIINLFEVIL